MEQFETNEFSEIQQVDLSVIEAQERAIIDKQIATAKAFPRNLQKVRQNIIAISSMDDETARSCSYSLPRGGKPITGKSIHLARIIVQQYGNVRVEAKIVSADSTHVTAQAMCIDLENNVGVKVDVKRRITDKNGRRFNDDMITVTGNAAAAIAYRNAVYNVVPKPLADAGYNAAQQKIIGDISDETKLAQKVKNAMDLFLKDYGVQESDVLKSLGLKETTQIRGDELKVLFGTYQALKDGDTTVDEAFYPDKKKEATEANKKATQEAAEKLKAKSGSGNLNDLNGQ